MIKSLRHMEGFFCRLLCRLWQRLQNSLDLLGFGEAVIGDELDARRVAAGQCAADILLEDMRDIVQGRQDGVDIDTAERRDIGSRVLQVRADTHFADGDGRRGIEQDFIVKVATPQRLSDHVTDLFADAELPLGLAGCIAHIVIPDCLYIY